MHLHTVFDNFTSESCAQIWIGTPDHFRSGERLRDFEDLKLSFGGNAWNSAAKEDVNDAFGAIEAGKMACTVAG